MSTQSPQKGKKEDPHNYRSVSLTPIFQKVLVQLILGAVSMHIKGKKDVGSRQHGFTKGKLCLTNKRSFYEDKTRWVDYGRAVDVI